MKVMAVVLLALLASLTAVTGCTGGVDVPPPPYVSASSAASNVNVNRSVPPPAVLNCRRNGLRVSRLTASADVVHTRGTALTALRRLGHVSHPRWVGAALVRKSSVNSAATVMWVAYTVLSPRQATGGLGGGHQLPPGSRFRVISLVRDSNLSLAGRFLCGIERR